MGDQRVFKNVHAILANHGRWQNGEARMHTVELLGHGLDLARRSGYDIRQEWLAGNSGGGCILKGRKIFFLDLALGPAEQLDQVLDTLRHDPEAAQLPMPQEVRDLLIVRKIA
jgi:hypothetical protein